MEIYLLRHGAAEIGQPGRADAERKLTDEGKNKTAEVVRLARRAGLDKPVVISSPYVRAVESAQIAMKELGVDDLVQSATLVPHGTPEAVWDEIRTYRDTDAVLLSGHEPLMSRLLAHFLNSPALKVDLKKSAIVRIDVEALGPAPHGVLRWMITPKFAV